MLKAKSVLMVVALGIALSATGCASSNKSAGDKSPGQPAASDIPAAYSKNCAACHGSSLEGGVGPNLTQVGARLSQEQIQTKIKQGGTAGMPAYEKVLTSEEINSLASWLASKK